jgi:hypothetical protein
MTNHRRFPETLKVESLKSFTKSFSHTHFSELKNAGGRQNLKDLGQNNAVCNLTDQQVKREKLFQKIKEKNIKYNI